MTELDGLFDDPAVLERIRNEAAFGYQEIISNIEKLPAGARVLEIGSGTGYLLAKLAAERPDIRFIGLEPIGPGFQAFAHILETIKTAYSTISILHTPVEEMVIDHAEDRFDLVFSVNVFEHLDNWRVAIDRIDHLLTPTGKHIVLCPNYVVPYEPHFGIPLLPTPTITRRVFSKYITTKEKDLGAEGLWRSLNFIKLTELKSHCRSCSISIDFDKGILGRMLKRLDDDPAFRQRQAGLAGIVMRVVGVTGCGVFDRLPALWQPYMRASLSSSQAYSPDK